MSEHRVAVFVGDKRIRVARCSCGWVGTPVLSSFKAEIEGTQHANQATDHPADAGGR